MIFNIDLHHMSFSLLSSYVYIMKSYKHLHKLYK
jgi:hypothetical protein